MLSLPYECFIDTVLAITGYKQKQMMLKTFFCLYSNTAIAV